MPEDAETRSLPVTAAGALLRRLSQGGVDAVFVNSGTDFPPIVEGLAEAEAHGWQVPRMVLVPHEHIAMGMAQGYYLAAGRAQAVILHTNVGLANGAIGAINAATDNVPMLLMSGRTPIVEKGRFGARTVPISWGQDMHDQQSLVRQAVKWEYEVRYPEQIPALVDRGLAIAGSTPRGPVYLSLPREPLTEECPPEELEAPISMRPAEIRADEASLTEVAERLLAAERPLIFAQQGAGTLAGFEALGRLARKWCIPVCQYWAVATAIAADHPMYVGQEPSPWLEEADVVLVLNSLAPWNPNVHVPAADATIIQLGPDPLQSRFPVRNFASHITVRGEVGPALADLEKIMESVSSGSPARAASRAELIASRNLARRASLEELVLAGAGTPSSKAWAARCVGDAIRGRRATVLSELGCPLDPLGLVDHGSWRQEPHSGGLGWSFACGMGMKLGDADRLVVATMGDGSYMFANPVACHQVAGSLGLALLVVVLNNGGYGAVRRSVLDHYPSGYAAKADRMPLVDLPTASRLAGVAEACGAHAETVEDGADLPGALARAMEVVSRGERHAFLEVLIGD